MKVFAFLAWHLTSLVFRRSGDTFCSPSIPSLFWKNSYAAWTTLLSFVHLLFSNSLIFIWIKILSISFFEDISYMHFFLFCLVLINGIIFSNVVVASGNHLYFLNFFLFLLAFFFSILCVLSLFSYYSINAPCHSHFYIVHPELPLWATDGLLWQHLYVLFLSFAFHT